MFYCPNNYNDPYPLYRVTPKNSYFRILHASPKSPAVDVYINDMLKFKNLTYGAFTDYIEVMAGNYNVKLYATGTKTTPVLNKNIFIPPEKIYTVAVIGLLPNIELLPIPEPIVINPSNNAYIKFAHLSPNLGAVDVALPDGKILLKNIKYKQFTDYIEVPVGTYTLEVRPTGTTNIALYVPNIKLKPNRFYTVYAVGLANDIPGLQALIPLDGSSYLDLRED
ncbi:DUF4397 domain-containing protein [Clostridium sp. CM028]|uniref:DUF4397 domain-containing protein n=1 Tax=unclassified Clostridium TaxID=2614128 RepID=UPI001C6F3334|nr:MULTISPECIES: DUF4397 domain-containing protein [unclassified Clostridium]MBW9145315.1 DUF4397 domain-containing protein [Clostridium sp. CM027]MBW9148871.1 DUF4397 domain-containing protein [Clostridium sp. CM028]UVE42454.1 DUF4397 domain-containing protein [Clostridium sp. CM027]WLC63026.1 DUF4397 domain-containing protein [Clostridium sp. CM028]